MTAAASVGAAYAQRDYSGNQPVRYPDPDIVTLDRVVCCDPDLSGLLGTVTARARRVIGLVYPRLTWWNRIAGFVLDSFGRLTGDARSRAHSRRAILNPSRAGK